MKDNRDPFLFTNFHYMKVMELMIVTIVKLSLNMIFNAVNIPRIKNTPRIQITPSGVTFFLHL